MFITLTDGSKIEYSSPVTAYEVAKNINEGLARNAIAALVDGVVCDLNTLLTEDCTLEILTSKDQRALKVLRHTCAHIMAQAVKRLYPDVQLAIGPAIDNGFYYDFDIDQPLTVEDLENIEAEMKVIIKENIPLERFVLPRQEAIDFAQKNGENYKVELITELPEGAEISFYRQDDFTDLCAGPHIQSTGKVKAFKLMSVAGAYWKGSEKNKMLQRIYGTAFFSKSELDAYLTMLEEAKKRDHRKLGRELDLFAIYDEGPGFPFFLPKGMVLRNKLEEYWRKIHDEAGYQEIKTPIILNEQLWHRSGHWDHYKDNMYFTEIDESDYAIKPMNCPGGMLVYKRKMHSYRDLPQRIAELGLVHRHELSGALHGLMRVRCFTQDDAHIFMLPSQIQDEIIRVINLIDKVYKLFGFKYHIELSTRPENSMGSDRDWEMATTALQNALDKLSLEYIINPGDGAFYGPKIDFHLEDSIGRTWQCGTIQLDFQMPERFDLTYIGDDNDKHRPVMIHRVVFGSIERFIAILTEHFAGAFPTWISPVQVKLLQISDSQAEYVESLYNKFKSLGIRVEKDTRNEKIGYKIREAQLEKIPYMLIIGEKEKETQTVSVRSRSKGDLGSMSIQDFIDKVTYEIDNMLCIYTSEQ